jgi:tRNA G18 (ribose-2'-O)-methylase SpoU
LKREETRRQRYDAKKKTAKTFPISIATINFKHDGNIGYLIRSAACFGADRVHVIGALPKRKILNPLSGSLVDYIDIDQHDDPSMFIEYAKNNNIKLISAELCEGAESIETYNFDFTQPVCIVVGHEETGIPAEILKNSDKIYIPMPGVGYCLNTSQAANVLLYEATTQYQNSGIKSYYLNDGKIEMHTGIEMWNQAGMYNIP